MRVNRRAALDEAIQRLYEVISFSEGGTPDWIGMRALFAPGARITRVTPEAVDALDLPGFEAMFTELLDCGAVLSFVELETARRVEFFGSVAHVLSSYETKRAVDALTPFGRGINSIQLLWTGDRWSVVSLLWDEGLSAATRKVEPLEVSYDDAA
jgi:hypothetical protein